MMVMQLLITKAFYVSLSRRAVTCRDIWRN